jgi:outer membrane biosynthesis protein TonB
MFEDFEKPAASKEGRGRMGASVVISGVIFFGIAAALAAAVATARAVVRKQSREVDVSFADLPVAPRPKPMVAKKNAAGPKKSVKRPMTSLKEIPLERPVEAEGDLALAEDTGPVDGIIEEKGPPPAPPPPPRVEAPEPPPPPPAEQEREVIEAPRFVSGCRAPGVPDALLTSAATIRIEVQMMIDVQGRVTTAKVVQSHPLIPDEEVLRCAREQVFQPATLPDGTAVPYPYRRRFVFKPAQA